MQTDTVTGPAAPTADSDLTAHERSRAFVALVVTIVLLVGVGVALDQITSQHRRLPFASVPKAVPFPRTVESPLTGSRGPGLGTAATGQRWGTPAGLWGAGPDGARLEIAAPTGSSYALIRTNRGTGTVDVTAATVAKGAGLAFRCKTPLDCWTLTAVPEFGTWKVTKILGGNPTDLGNIGTTPVGAGTQLRVATSADAVEISVNGVLARRIEDRDLDDASRAGLVTEPDPAAGTARFRDFRAVQDDILGPDAAVHDAFVRPDGRGFGSGADGGAVAQ